MGSGGEGRWGQRVGFRCHRRPRERARRLPGAARGGPRLSCCTCVTAEGRVLSGVVGVRHGSGGKADFCDRPVNVRW